MKIPSTRVKVLVSVLLIAVLPAFADQLTTSVEWIWKVPPTAIGQSFKSTGVVGYSNYLKNGEFEVVLGTTLEDESRFQVVAFDEDGKRHLLRKLELPESSDLKVGTYHLVDERNVPPIVSIGVETQDKCKVSGADAVSDLATRSMFEVTRNGDVEGLFPKTLEGLSCPIGCGPPSPADSNVYLVFSSDNSKTGAMLYRGFCDRDTVVTKHTKFNVVQYNEGELESTLNPVILDKSTAGVCVFLSDDELDPPSLVPAYTSIPVVIARLQPESRVGCVNIGAERVPLITNSDPERLGYNANLLLMKDWGRRKIEMAPIYSSDAKYMEYVQSFKASVFGETTILPE